jgi:hypothetical protein
VAVRSPAAGNATNWIPVSCYRQRCLGRRATSAYRDHVEEVDGNPICSRRKAADSTISGLGVGGQ